MSAFDPAGTLTIGELRAALVGLPDDDPVMLVLDDHNAAWAKRAVHDPRAGGLDVHADRPLNPAYTQVSTAELERLRRIETSAREVLKYEMPHECQHLDLRAALGGQAS